ncbi:MAG: YebC/PmpR family DNA-binding transcriptional regulator [Rickettsiales bacterium]|nr:YebC/PmpR family DNA-binding transcriptional regulator [Rickettsiales bacterium]
MAGHSKWANIQHRKGAQDKKRSSLFTKLAKEITIAAKIGDSNPDMNPRLRLAINNAKKLSMPNDNIKRAIDKAASNAAGDNYAEARYEGYGPGSVAVIVEALTDNPNRTAPEIRATFNKAGGNMGTPGSVAFSFKKEGLILYEKKNIDEEKIFEVAIESGADNIETDENGYAITTAPEDFTSVMNELEKHFGEAQSAEIVWTPLNTVKLDDETKAKFEKFRDALEDLDDVQNVYSNEE